MLHSECPNSAKRLRKKGQLSRFPSSSWTSDALSCVRLARGSLPSVLEYTMNATPNAGAAFVPLEVGGIRSHPSALPIS